MTSPSPTPTGKAATMSAPQIRHPDGCAFCPAELLGLERDANGDPLCQTCPHLNARPERLARDDRKD